MCSTFTASAAEPEHVWKAIAFGQSTDMNFSSNVLPDKIGVNDVTLGGKKLTPQDAVDLSKPVTIESRGGKIANSHDGLTFSIPRYLQGKLCLAGHRQWISLARKMAPNRLRRRCRAAGARHHRRSASTAA
jgi:hypothetical protein